MRQPSPVLATVRQDWTHLVLGELSAWALSVTLVVSLMHFWYDGFVWSVRRSDV